MTTQETIPYDIVREALPEQTRNSEVILDHFTAGTADYMALHDRRRELTPAECSSVAVMSTSLALTADFIDTMTGRQNGLAPLSAFTSAIDGIVKSSSEAITKVPEDERVGYHVERMENSSKLSRLLNASMVCVGLLDNERRGNQVKPSHVLNISDQLELKPRTKLKLTIGRRSQQSLAEGIGRMAGDQGVEAAHTLALSSFLVVDSMIQLNTFGTHLASMELNIPNEKNVMKSPAIRRGFADCATNEEKLLEQLLTTGYVNPEDLQKHRVRLMKLTDQLLKAPAIPVDSAYLRAVQRSQEDALLTERKIAVENAGIFLGVKGEEGYDEFLQRAYRLSQSVVTKRHKEFTGEDESSESLPVPDEPIPTPGEPEAPIANDQAERIAELRAQHEALMRSLGALRQPYQPSANALKAVGLRDIQYDLRNGLEDADGEHILEGVTRGDAQFIAQMLHGLGLRYGQGGGEAFRIDVSHDLANEIELVSAVKTIRNELLTYGQNGFETLGTNLCNTFEWLGTNKPALQTIISSRVPAKAAYYNQMLDELLDMSDRYALEPDVTEPGEGQQESEPHTLETEPETQELPNDLDVFVPLQETDVALQLDWEVFPPDVTLSEIQSLTKGAFSESDAAGIDWSRIADLLEITKAYGGNVYRARPRSLGTTEPYFVAETDINGKTFVVAENPQYGNATYILRADLAYDGASWREVLEQSREFARILGAERIVHSDKRKHLERIMSNIQSQLLIKAK
jgi:hypothetical protein